MSDSLKPRMLALSETFSRPVNSGLKPAPSSSSAAILPLTSTMPALGASVPQITCSKVDLPEPLRPTMPTVSPRATVRSMPRSAWNSRNQRALSRVIICSSR